MNKELLRLALTVLEKCKYDRKYEMNRTLGMGCERVAYALSPGLVVKIAKHAFIGSIDDADEDDIDDRYDYSEEWQTEKEIEIWEKMLPEEKALFNPILVSGEFDGFAFAVSPMVEIEEGESRDAVDYCKRNGLQFDFELLRKVAKKYDLDYFDMVENTANFGRNKEGKLVVTDFGLLTF